MLTNVIQTVELFPEQQNLDSLKLKKFAVDNFKLDENGRVLQTGIKHC